MAGIVLSARSTASRCRRRIARTPVSTASRSSRLCVRPVRSASRSISAIVSGRNATNASGPKLSCPVQGRIEISDGALFGVGELPSARRNRKHVPRERVRLGRQGRLELRQRLTRSRLPHRLLLSVPPVLRKGPCRRPDVGPPVRVPRFVDDTARHVASSPQVLPLPLSAVWGSTRRDRNALVWGTGCHSPALAVEFR